MIQLKVVGPGTRLWGTPRWYPRLGWGTSIICVRYKTNIIKDMDTCLYFPADTRSAKCIHYHHFSKSFHFLSQLFSCLIAWTDCSSSKRIVRQSQDLRWLPQIPSPWGNFESVHGLNLCASKTPLSSNLSFIYFSTFLFLLQSKTNVGKHNRQQMLECWAKNKSAGGTQHIGQPQWSEMDSWWFLDLDPEPTVHISLQILHNPLSSSSQLFFYSRLWELVTKESTCIRGKNSNVCLWLMLLKGSRVE